MQINKDKIQRKTHLKLNPKNIAHQPPAQRVGFLATGRIQKSSLRPPFDKGGLGGIYRIAGVHRETLWYWLTYFVFICVLRIFFYSSVLLTCKLFKFCQASGTQF